MTTVQLIGSTTLTRVALPYLGERAGVRVVAVDVGDEDEHRPWFAPVRGRCRELGVAVGRRDAELTLDLDPDARGLGLGVRAVGPRGVSPDLCRAVQQGGPWRMVFGGAGVIAEVVLATDGDAQTVLNRATLRGVEALAEGWERREEAGDGALVLAPDRFRTSEAQIVWQQSAAAVLGKLRAFGGPWGGARTHLGETPIWVEAAEPAAGRHDEMPGTILSVDHGVVVACGFGAVRLLTVRPSWRPARPMAELCGEVGAGPGYVLV